MNATKYFGVPGRPCRDLRSPHACRYRDAQFLHLLFRHHTAQKPLKATFLVSLCWKDDIDHHYYIYPCMRAFKANRLPRYLASFWRQIEAYIYTYTCHFHLQIKIYEKRLHCYSHFHFKLNTNYIYIIGHKYKKKKRNKKWTSLWDCSCRLNFKSF